MFRFDDLPAGPAVIYAHANGFAPYFGELTVDGGKVHERQLGLLLEALRAGRSSTRTIPLPPARTST